MPTMGMIQGAVVMQTTMVDLPYVKMAFTVGPENRKQHQHVYTNWWESHL